MLRKQAKGRRLLVDGDSATQSRVAYPVPLIAIVIMTALAAPRSSAQALAVVDPASGLRLLVTDSTRRGDD